LTTYIYNDSSGNVTKNYSFDGDQVLGDDAGNYVDWDVNNGRQTSQLSDEPTDYALEYDWDSRLRKGLAGSANNRMEAKYTPYTVSLTGDGVRVEKKSIVNGDTDYSHRYIVDVSGRVPAILLVIDADGIYKTYIHANGQVLAQHDGDHTTARYFYLHDRLGSVREVIDQNGVVVNSYTYDPWGLPVGDETQETMSNLYRFANYVWDTEISQYHCYRRQYDPVLGRFTARDPVEGSYEEPMTLHKYLYCLNNAINEKDPTGELGLGLGGLVGETISGMESYYTGLDMGLQMAGGSWEGILDATISANNFRETYFSYSSLKRPYELVDTSKAWNSIYNACDWGALARCVGWDYLSGLKYEIPLVLVGEISCMVCYSDFEPVSKAGFCIGCGIYRYSSGARTMAGLLDIEQCAEKHCKLGR